MTDLNTWENPLTLLFSIFERQIKCESFSQTCSKIIKNTSQTYTLLIHLLLFLVTLPYRDSQHSTFQISYPFSLTQVIPNESVQVQGPV